MVPVVHLITDIFWTDFWGSWLRWFSPCGSTDAGRSRGHGGGQLLHRAET